MSYVTSIRRFLFFPFAFPIKPRSLSRFPFRTAASQPSRSGRQPCRPFDLQVWWNWGGLSFIAYIPITYSSLRCVIVCTCYSEPPRYGVSWRYHGTGSLASQHGVPGACGPFITEGLRRFARYGVTDACLLNMFHWGAHRFVVIAALYVLS